MQHELAQCGIKRKNTDSKAWTGKKTREEIIKTLTARKRLMSRYELAIELNIPESTVGNNLCALKKDGLVVTYLKDGRSKEWGLAGVRYERRVIGDEVFKLIKGDEVGYTAKELSIELGVSEVTVHYQLKKLLDERLIRGGEFRKRSRVWIAV